VRLDEQEVDRRAALRMARQQVFDGQHAPRLWAIIDEAVLRRPIGGAAVLREQIAALIEACQRPQVRLQVMPFASGGHSAMGGAFSIMRFPHQDVPDVVYIEHLTSGLYLEKREEVDRYSIAFGRLSVEAEPPGRTLGILRAILSDLDR
jgi:Domain of unknown function (DUF5753)